MKHHNVENISNNQIEQQEKKEHDKFDAFRKIVPAVILMTLFASGKLSATEKGPTEQMSETIQQEIQTESDSLLTQAINEVKPFKALENYERLKHLENIHWNEIIEASAENLKYYFSHLKQLEYVAITEICNKHQDMVLQHCDQLKDIEGINWAEIIKQHPRIAIQHYDQLKDINLLSKDKEDKFKEEIIKRNLDNILDGKIKAENKIGNKSIKKESWQEFINTHPYIAFKYWKQLSAEGINLQKVFEANAFEVFDNYLTYKDVKGINWQKLFEAQGESIFYKYDNKALQEVAKRENIDWQKLAELVAPIHVIYAYCFLGLEYEHINWRKLFESNPKKILDAAIIMSAPANKAVREIADKANINWQTIVELAPAYAWENREHLKDLHGINWEKIKRMAGEKRKKKK